MGTRLLEYSAATMEVGLYTFGGLTADPYTGQRIEALERYRQVLQLAQLAEQAGLDVFGVGEHHRRAAAAP